MAFRHRDRRVSLSLSVQHTFISTVMSFVPDPVHAIIIVTAIIIIESHRNTLRPVRD